MLADSIPARRACIRDAELTHIWAGRRLRPRRKLDAAVRALAAKGQFDHGNSIRRIGDLVLLASADGAMVCEQHRLVYQAEDGGRRVLVYRPGPWALVCLRSAHRGK